MERSESLREYRKRRDFKSTGEPRGKIGRSQGRCRFVIQKHDATSLHYDFRLEVGGVLKSWAIPKGPSTDPKEKRLAMATEDHPLEYRDFEGVIPEGEYGAGSVIVWDAGTYRDLGELPVQKQLERGHLAIQLNGKKLRGGYAFHRMAKGKRERWLLVKMDDDAADARRNPVKTEPKSVLTGLTIEEVTKEAKEKQAKPKRTRATASKKKRAPAAKESRPRNERAGQTKSRRPRSFEISNEDKVFFPESGITKGDLIDYYERVSDVMLPHVRGRIVTMRRYPDGIDGFSFYQKDVPDYFPDWIRTVEVRKKGGRLRQLIIEHRATLAYLANQGCIDIHVWPSRADKPDHPDRLILDLDPSTDDFGLVRKAARAVREVLEAVGLTPYVMTTGSNGLHVVSPLDRKADFDETRDFASSVAKLVAAQAPEHFTVEQRKNKRRGRVFIDYLRNAYAQHGIAPYSVRARPGAPVAAPLAWEELRDAKLHARKYTIKNLFRRLSRKDDPWQDIAAHASSLSKARRRLDERIHDDRNR